MLEAACVRAVGEIDVEKEMENEDSTMDVKGPIAALFGEQIFHYDTNFFYDRIPDHYE